MSEGKIIKGIEDVATTQEDLNKCMEYEKRICNGENIIIEANKFAIDKVNEIFEKSPEIILFNRVERKYDPITKESVLRNLAIAKQVVNDQLLKDSINLTKDSWEELKKQ